MDFVATEYALISARGIHGKPLRYFPVVCILRRFNGLELSIECSSEQVDKDRGECMQNR